MAVYDSKYNGAELDDALDDALSHIQDKSNPHSVTKAQLGLGNVENKSSSKIRGELTSANVTSALGYTPINQNEKGANSGVATLGADGKVPSNQLPSYVDDVLEYATRSVFPATGESGKIYVDLSTDRTYRWSGTQYTPIKGDLAIGSTTGTAADGGVVNTHITDSTIHVTSTEKQTWNNKQKAIAEGRGITITPGADADTVSFNLPIDAGSGAESIVEGAYTTASGFSSHAEGGSTTASGTFSHAEGISTQALGEGSHAEGVDTIANAGNSHAEGFRTIASNEGEHASGHYNVSNQASETFGDGGNTLFSVGNGTANNARHNAFEIRQNGDIYITNGGQDVKLQETLGNKVDKTTTVNGHALSGNVTVTKSDVELGNVDNTADANKNVAYASVAGSATKLQTARTLWGQAFDGTANVSGSITGVTTINRYLSLTSDGSPNPILNISTVTVNEGTDYISVYVTATHRPLVFQLDAGYVGIGVAQPAYKLDVYGSANATTLYENGNRVVTTVASQGLTETEKNNARTNLGLGSMATKDSLAESDIPSIHKSKISDFPTSLPANGGNSTTVNGHTVLSDVPANAVFTDTDTWRPLGTGATDACAGNDSRLSDSRVASNMIANYTEVSSNTSGVTTSLTQDGSETKVYYNSGSAAVTVSFATSGLVFTDGNDSMEIPAGGYGEVNFLRVTTGNTTRVFVRSIVSE